jgi:hypothetical protein
VLLIVLVIVSMFYGGGPTAFDLRPHLR